jgi:chemotaxis protein histidine kinase CheA
MPMRRAGAFVTPATSTYNHSWPCAPALERDVPDVELELLRSVWQQRRGLVRNRVDTVAAAVRALEAGSLTPRVRDEAQRAAHMLAGSLGMFGRLPASRAARDLEHELERPTPRRVPVLMAQLSRLRQAVDR